ncbi:hypothetical protein MPH_09574 [Macrophomina phaseolina MS6]|uniref:Uncharacterized protein n=1 Tax=Macrophomina phaseolina (strain MS6) TaxID=1126212 RepID=K2RKB0_MACPH|nr:hypothetical protein MPH_09574 [Macrophomina phaseolina MS6]
MMSQSSLSSSGLSEKMASGKSAAPAQHGKSGKRGLNLLNPMSLLLRRRSAQALQHLSEESLVTHRNNVVPAMSMGDDFDPSIRGNIVHDFSAPKPRRAVSYDPYVNNNRLGISDAETRRQSRRNYDDESPSKRDRSHTPVFKENFDDNTDADDEKRKLAIRAETLANQDFLARNGVPDSEPEPPAPPFGRIAPGGPQMIRKAIPPPLTQVPVQEDVAGGLATVPEASPTSPVSNESKRSSTAKTPPKSRSRATSGADSGFQPAGLPTHMTSRASRFSFQIAGVDSAAQEKLLEEKHRQKVAAREGTSGRSGDDYGEDEDDMFDYDNIDEDMFPGFEEEVPIIGDYDDDYGNEGYGYSAAATGLASYDYNTINGRIPFNNTLSPISAGGESSLATPRDSSGNVIGSAFTDDHQKFAPAPSPLGAPPVNGGYQDGQDATGLGLVGNELLSNELAQVHISPAAESESQHIFEQSRKENILEDDDDLYFDDGLIGEPDPPEDGEKFDESVFDDPSHPLYERPAPPMKSQPLDDTGITSEDLDPEDEQASKSGLAPHPSMRGNGRPFQASSDPFEFSNPHDYFSALVEATHKAEADGRFTRKNSIATKNLSLRGREENEQDEQSRNTVRDSQDSAPSLVPDSGRVSGAIESFPPNALDDLGDMTFDPDAYGDDYGDGFDDYDSALEDDPIIAAANAEALANDYEGEYGSEFGFYAAANGGAEAVYGGYFGPRDMLGRSVSGRYAVREPNLTPITERSEYSTRNSFIGIGPWSAAPTSAGGAGPHNSAGALPSPGLAQLARMSPYGFPPGSEDDYDYDYKLEQLMKLRKGAFGGAGTASPGGSANSSPRNSSPLSYFPGSFPGRGSSPVATRAKSALDTYSDLPEVEETPNEATVEMEAEEGNIPETNNEEALVSEINRTDSVSDVSASIYDEQCSHKPSEPPAQKNLPHQINTNYEAFLPDHPGNIPPSVPTSAISTTSTNSLPMSYSSANNNSANIPPAPLLSPTSPPQLQTDLAGSDPQKQLPYPAASEQSQAFFHHAATAHNRDTAPALNVAVFSPLSPTSPTSSTLAEHPNQKSGGRHSRTSSGGMDSVTYVRERIERDEVDGGCGGGPSGDAHGVEDGGGKQPEFRWVLERRRTSGTGEVEVVGREIVEGGRI